MNDLNRVIEEVRPTLEAWGIVPPVDAIQTDTYMENTFPLLMMGLTLRIMGTHQFPPRDIVMLMSVLAALLDLADEDEIIEETILFARKIGEEVDKIRTQEKGNTHD